MKRKKQSATNPAQSERTKTGGAGHKLRSTYSPRGFQRGRIGNKQAGRVVVEKRREYKTQEGKTYYKLDE